MDQIRLPLPAELLAQIDAARKGTDVARTVWIRRAIEIRLMARNLTPDEVARIIDGWRFATEHREMNDTDRAIAAKVEATGEGDGS